MIKNRRDYGNTYPQKTKRPLHCVTATESFFYDYELFYLFIYCYCILFLEIFLIVAFENLTARVSLDGLTDQILVGGLDRARAIEFDYR